MLSFTYLKTTHSYHLVYPILRPIVSAFGAFMFAVGGILYMSQFNCGWGLFITGFIIILYTMYTWWRDILKPYIHNITAKAKRHTIVTLILTLVLAILFIGLQGFEYVNAPFCISDGACFSKSIVFILGFANICRKLYYSFIARWLFSTNHKDIGTLSLQIVRILKRSSTRLFSRNVSSQNHPKPGNNKSLKTMIFDSFLKYQFNMCTQSHIPWTHLILVSVLTSIFNTYRYIILYWFSIIFILTSLYLLETFPDSFGKRYIAFLKINSSPDAFNTYFGNPAGTIKAFLGNPEWLKLVFKNGVAKGVKMTAGALVAEHTFHHAKAGQVYEYVIDKQLNNGVHSSGERFSFRDNGPSMADKIIGRTGSWRPSR